LAWTEWWDLYSVEEIDMPRHPDYATDACGQRVLEGIEVYSKPLTEEKVWRAHRACYANISYFDSKIGALVRTVEEMGQLDDNMSIVTADHGDMLGEKGL
jgi:choline-sulfatase